MIKKMLFVLTEYPTGETLANIFAKDLIFRISETGVGCTVIAPQNLFAILANKKKKVPEVRIERNANGDEIRIYSPIYCFYRPMKLLCRWTLLSSMSSILRTIKKHHIEFDYIYSHFIYPHGLMCPEIAKQYKKKSCVAVGEATRLFYDVNGSYERLKEKTGWLNKMSKFNKVITVSESNKTALISQRYIDIQMSSNIMTIPNATDTSVFYPRDKESIRKELNMPIDAFIIVYCGTFDARKGSDRVCKAISLLQDVYSIFIGYGTMPPSCDNILFCGKLEHKDVPKYLSAADVFVLPTRSEGCSNAIVEALASGLPVISSVGEFNDMLLNEKNSIRVNPDSIIEIKEAIDKLKSNKDLRMSMASNAREFSLQMDLKHRAERIISFLS